MTTAFAQPAPVAFAQPDAGYKRPAVKGIAGEISTLVITTVQDAARNAPRSRQAAPGPSELGVPCDRRLAYKIMDWDRPNDSRDQWPSTIGTSVHAWMATTFAAENRRIHAAREAAGIPRWPNGQPQPTPDRYLIERRVHLPYDISGSADLFDRDTGRVIDWKVVGLPKIKEYRVKGPGQQYRVQAHLYGLGMLLAGETVADVADVFLPRGGRLEDLYVWTEPFNPAIATEALNRYEAIKQKVITLDPQIRPATWAAFPTAESYCTYCPFHLPHSADLSKGCPGHRSRPRK
jgi:hypothetical protein